MTTLTSHRTLLPLALGLVLTALFLPAAAAQSPTWTSLGTDPELDARATSYCPSYAVCSEQLNPHVDLTQLEVSEDEARFHVRLSTRSGTEAPAGQTREYKTAVSMLVGGHVYELRASLRDGFQFWQIQSKSGGSLSGGESAGYQDYSHALSAPPTAAPYDYTVSIAKTAFMEAGVEAGPQPVSQMFVDAWVLSQDYGEAYDRLPDTGFADAFEIRVPGVEEAGRLLGYWHEIAGPDFAVGLGVAVGPSDEVHASYIVFSGVRGVAPGLYHARVDESAWRPERIADVDLPPESDPKTTGSIVNTSTALDIDRQGAAHILYYPAPSGSAAIRHATNVNGTWTIDDPARLADGRSLRVDAGRRAVPALVADRGRLVAAFQALDPARVVVVERAAEGWKELAHFDGATFPRLAIGADGIHIAFFTAEREEGPNSGTYGSVSHASEAGGWTPGVAAKEIHDLSKFWNTAETDGSFAFALTPDGTPSLVYESATREARRFAQLRNGSWTDETSPLHPSHGNPQVRMRLVFDPEGNAHMASGYGGLDLYAMRTPEALWSVVDGPTSYGQFGLDVTRTGQAVLIGMQPHGGETVAVSRLSDRPSSSQPVPQDGRNELHAIAAPGAVAALAVLSLIGVAGAWKTLHGAYASERALSAFAKPLAIFAGFSRLHRDELLEHETRETIVEAVRASPGSPASEVRRVLGIGPTAFYYHLRRLQGEGLLKSVRQDGKLFLTLGPKSLAASEPVVIESFDSRLLSLLVEDPSATTIQLADRLGSNPRTVRFHLARLERAGRLVAIRENSRSVRWVPRAG